MIRKYKKLSINELIGYLFYLKKTIYSQIKVEEFEEFYWRIIHFREEYIKAQNDNFLKNVGEFYLEMYSDEITNYDLFNAKYIREYNLY